MRVVVEADGGSRGNPGPAGYGAVVFSEGGDVLAERAESIGIATNNVAEYQGLIAGLTAARELGATEVAVRMDSKLVVEQMSGRWQVKHAAMKPLFAAAREVAADFDAVTYTWIPRAQNAHADRLANEAMDGKPSRAEQPAPVDTTAPAKWTGATGTPTRFLLLRHGQTELSGERRYSGRGDVELTATGQRQAKAAAARLSTMDFAAVVSSPLARARQTAAAITDQVTVHEGLIETDFGDWERLTFAEAAARDPELHGRWIRDPAVPAPNGESFDAVHARFVLHAMTEHEEQQLWAAAPRVLRPGGRLYVECLSINDRGARRGEVLSRTQLVEMTRSAASENNERSIDLAARSRQREGSAQPCRVRRGASNERTPKRMKS